MYKTSKGIKFCEEDSFKHGCLPDTGFLMDVDVTFEAESKEDVLKLMTEFYGVNIEDLELNACGEIGRVDISVIENANSHKPSEREIEQWKQGKIKLYHTIYTHRVFKCEYVELPTNL